MFFAFHLRMFVLTNFQLIFRGFLMFKSKSKLSDKSVKDALYAYALNCLLYDTKKGSIIIIGGLLLILNIAMN